jgi:hypothetical protein
MKEVLAIFMPLPVVLASKSLGTVLKCATIWLGVALQVFSKER